MYLLCLLHAVRRDTEARVYGDYPIQEKLQPPRVCYNLMADCTLAPPLKSGVNAVNILLRRFCTIMEISRQKETRSRDYALIFSNNFKVFFILQSTIDSTAHSRPLNSLEHCICTTLMTNMRHGRNSNPVHLSFEEPDRKNHWGWLNKIR